MTTNVVICCLVATLPGQSFGFMDSCWRSWAVILSYLVVGIGGCVVVVVVDGGEEECDML